MAQSMGLHNQWGQTPLIPVKQGRNGVRSFVITFFCYYYRMARPLRLELAGGLYHVTSRGDGRENIYLTDADRQAWLDVMAQVCLRFD